MERLLARCEAGAALIGAGGLLAILVLALAELTARNLFNAPILGLVDMVEWFLPFAALLGAAAAQNAREHIRMDILVKSLSQAARPRLELFGSALGAVFCGIVALFGAMAAHRSFIVGGVSPDIAWPLWPPKAMIALTFLLMALRLALQAVEDAKAAFHE